VGVSENIRKLRSKRNLSLRGLALKAHISSSTLSDIENNKTNPSIKTLQNIAVALNVDVNILIKEDGKEISGYIDEIPLFQPTITVKEQEKLETQAKNIVDEFAISLAQNKDMLDDNDYLVLQASINSALQAITLKNKEKYTTNKNKRKK
jgi:transcriptional regulator with XRE-family HTH domain